jgi:hypothetical protein
MQQYQVSKTVRFGLTNNPKVNKCHTQLADLVSDSEKSIKEEAEKNNKHSINDTVTLLKYTKKCLDQIDDFIKDWTLIFKREDLLYLTFEHYSQIAKKARFDARWKDKFDKIQPSRSKLVSFKILKANYNGKERIKLLNNYWENNLFETKQKRAELSKYLAKFQNAIQENETHKSLNLVEFRKICLQLFRLVNETLTPLCQNSITLDNKRGQLSNKDKFIDTFYNELPLLVEKIEKLKTYFSENGGYVPFGRVTLNKKTASQKPHMFDFKDVFSKDNFISIPFAEGLYNFVVNFNDYDEQKEEKITKAVEQFFKQKKEKIDLYNNSNLCLMERVQYFKYKNIPLAVRYPLADYFAKEKNWDVAIVRKIFDVYGNPISLNKDYLEDSKNFHFENYPLKQAFDFAWDNAAKSLYNKNIEAPLQKSIDYLDKYFKIKLNDKNLRLYAHLLELNQQLAVLDHTDESADKRLETRTKVENSIKSLQKENSWLNDDWFVAIQERLKFNNLKQDKLKPFVLRNYTIAKQKLGQIRGKQKLGYEKSIYSNLTQSFKEVSRNYGNGFTALREKLSENTNLNKIDYLGVIVEDKNNDRYILMQPLNEDRKGIEELFIPKNNGDFDFYEIESLTSKALEKLIKNPKSENSKTLHSNEKNLAFDLEKVKKEWKTYKDEPDFIAYLKDCLTNSKMAKDQNWADYHLDIETLKTYDEIAKEIDKNCYRLKKHTKKISKASIEVYIKKGAKLLPIVNQDITSKTKELKNQFSKDWNTVFENGFYRLHPEFNISYRMPTPNYPKPEEKRYSRFQMIGQFMIEHYPNDLTFISRKEQIVNSNDKEKQKDTIIAFNKPIYKDRENKFVIGIDRGIKKLTTLCLLNPQGQIQGDFKIYTRTFNEVKKRFEHTFSEVRSILDLTNLRVETTVCIDGIDSVEKVLVDLSLIEVAVGRDKDTNKPLRDEKGNIKFKANKQKIKLKQMAYWRKIQYAFMDSKVNEAVSNYFIEHYQILKEGKLTEEFLKNMPHISPYGEGKAFEDFPFEEFRQLALKFVEHKKNDTLVKLNDELELSSVDDLKKGIMSNMIGVVVYIMDLVYQNHKSIPLISLENLCRAWGYGKDGLDGNNLAQSFNKSNITNEKITFKQQENLKLAGLGLYHFFEMQLLKKIMKLNVERNYPYPLVPPVRAVKDYEVVSRLSKLENGEYFCEEPFGIVTFVDPDNTSKACPCCGSKKNIERKAVYDEIICKNCEFITIWDLEQEENITLKTKEKRYSIEVIEKSKNALKKNGKLLDGKEKTELNLEYIHNGDDNAAYHIALKTLRNIQP